MKTCPLELTAMPATSPKYRSAGRCRKSGTESNGISGGWLCAVPSTVHDRNHAIPSVSQIAFIFELLFGQARPCRDHNSRCSGPWGSSTSLHSLLNIIVARRVLSYGAHFGSPEWLGSPVRANATQTLLIRVARS